MIRPNKIITHNIDNKIYKRWSFVRNVFGQNSIIASKKNNSEITQLLLTEKGHRRELYSNNCKVMDIIDPKGVKRVYIYQKTNNNIIEGKMITENKTGSNAPLILSAKWMLINTCPKEITIKLNSKHPRAKIFIKNGKPDINDLNENTPGGIKITEIIAKDFDNSYYPLPKTIILTTDKGSRKIVTGKYGKDNLDIIRYFGIESEILGSKFRTIV